MRNFSFNSTTMSFRYIWCIPSGKAKIRKCFNTNVHIRHCKTSKKKEKKIEVLNCPMLCSQTNNLSHRTFYNRTEMNIPTAASSLFPSKFALIMVQISIIIMVFLVVVPPHQLHLKEIVLVPWIDMNWKARSCTDGLEIGTMEVRWVELRVGESETESEKCYVFDYD